MSGNRLIVEMINEDRFFNSQIGVISAKFINNLGGNSQSSNNTNMVTINSNELNYFLDLLETLSVLFEEENPNFPIFNKQLFKALVQYCENAKAEEDLTFEQTIKFIRVVRVQKMMLGDNSGYHNALHHLMSALIMHKDKLLLL